jgi:hypothetical protein
MYVYFLCSPSTMVKEELQCISEDFLMADISMESVEKPQN